MPSGSNHPPNDLDVHFKIFHELMANKVREILLVLSPYDAFIMEEDASLASKIINEYHGLNLSHPPRLTRVSTAQQALAAVGTRKFDLVITMPQVDDMDAFALGRKLKKINPSLPVILLTHNPSGLYPAPAGHDTWGIDRLFVWSPDPDLLLALVKNVEDHSNVDNDTRQAMVRVLILVEDSPAYRSFFLPMIYQAVVKQTQAVLDDSLNEEHRLLKMRARPKILVAENFEQAMSLYHRYQPFVFGIFSDTRFPKNGKMADNAGIDLLTHIRHEIPDLPLLLLSSDAANEKKAEQIPAVFLNKNSPLIASQIRSFFLTHLGFGDFVFRLPDGTEVDRATGLASFEKKLHTISDQTLEYHAKRNHFSNWVMARSEVELALDIHKNRLADLKNTDDIRRQIIAKVHNVRRLRQQGVVVQFSHQDFDSEITDFMKIGQGSMGGKALGLAFMASQLKKSTAFRKKFPETAIIIPKTLVITTDGFDSFVGQNKLRHLSACQDDSETARLFMAAAMPDWLTQELDSFLGQNQGPLSIRSSSPLEDAQFRPYAGLFATYMIPNNHPDPAVRLSQLLTAVKLVFASAYFIGPRDFSRATASMSVASEPSMAVIIQPAAGRVQGDYFYPAVSGVAQSHNFYPISHMKPADGIAHIALGFGKTVVDGELSLRFSPRHPGIIPQFSTVDDILANAQRFFYALKVNNYPDNLNFTENSNLDRREIIAATAEIPVRNLTSTYIPAEHRIRDQSGPGAAVLTFAPILKHRIFPLPEILSEILEIGRRGMGCPIEIEFAADLQDETGNGTFYFLQIRPMVVGGERFDVGIDPGEIDKAFCFSPQALGHGKKQQIADIVYVKPAAFDPKATRQIAGEISKFNAGLNKDSVPYLLIGAGRWGSADPWLGIPVQWQDISGVAAIIELRNKQLKADPSEGTHFFQNITSLGIPYLTVTEDTKGGGFIDWDWLETLPTVSETALLKHVRLEKALTVKIDGQKLQGLISKIED